VELAEQAGVYVILDLHGAPGCQSVDMPSGRVGQNKLWTDARAQRKTIFLWRELAKRYGNRPAVVAYDLINEPFGDPAEDIRPELVKLVDRTYAAIREVDQETLILAPASRRGIACYGDPRQRGWVNTGFTDHYYPGLFGQGEPTLAAHSDLLQYVVPVQRDLLAQYEAPFLVGEFNVVFDFLAQPELMRCYYDTFARCGWMATMWSLRCQTSGGGVGDNNWCLAANATPSRLPDLRTASFEEIARGFRELGTVELAVDEELRDALAAEPAPRFYLPRTRTSVERETTNLDGWTSKPVGDCLSGRAARCKADAFTITGGGIDVWGTQDEFQYTYRKVSGDADLDVRMPAFDGSDEFAKAGVMLRSSTSSDAAHAFIHVFEDGRVMFASRESAGRPTTEQCLAISGFPVSLGLRREDQQLYARFTDLDGAWQEEKVALPSALSGGLLGLAVCAHDDRALMPVTFQAVEQTLDPAEPSAPKPCNLLANGSFEQAHDAPQDSDTAAHWGRWGHWINRETTWTPVRDGHCLLAYHHWRITNQEDSGVYQDVSSIQPGTSYTFSIDACRDVPEAGGHGPQSVEIRLECLDGRRILRSAAHTYRFADIALGGGWSRLQVTGVAQTDTMRVVIIVRPSTTTPRSSAMKFDKAMLYAADAGIAHGN
jgi:hypothetical protein